MGHREDTFILLVGVAATLYASLKVRWQIGEPGAVVKTLLTAAATWRISNTEARSAPSPSRPYHEDVTQPPLRRHFHGKDNDHRNIDAISRRARRADRGGAARSIDRGNFPAPLPIGAELATPEHLKKCCAAVAIVGTSKLRSRNKFRISQLVSAMRRQPWHAAPCVARSPLRSSGP
jgi:hypothetical protein